MKETVTIPRNVIKPVNSRIFAVSFDPGERKTKANIILPTQYQKGEKNKRIKLERYFIVDIDPECKLAKEKGAKRGDEIFPFIPEGAIALDWPFVVDWPINEKYWVFHETELAGFCSAEDAGDIEEDEN